MGNFCGLCSCIYPKLDEFDDEEYFASKFAIERSRENHGGSVYSKQSTNGIHADAASISSYSSSRQSGAFSSQALAQRRLSLLSSHKFDRQSLLSAEIFTIYSPIRFPTRDQVNVLWPSLSSANSSIVSLNDHKLFMEVADLHMSEIKRQFKQDTAAANMSMFVRPPVHEDSGINMSLNSTASSLLTPTKSVKQTLFTTSDIDMMMTPSSPINCAQQQQDDDSETTTANQRGGNIDKADEREHHQSFVSPLVYFFKTLNAMTSSLIKTAAYLNSASSSPSSLTVGSNYLYKWSAKNSITKLRSKMFKLATFSINAFVNTTTTTPTPTTNNKPKSNMFKSSTSTKNKSSQKNSTIERPQALTDIFFNDCELDSSLTTLYGVSDTYALAKTSPLRQFILRVYDANFF